MTEQRWAIRWELVRQLWVDSSLNPTNFIAKVTSRIRVESDSDQLCCFDVVV